MEAAAVGGSVAPFAHFGDKDSPAPTFCLYAFLLSEGPEGLLVGRRQEAAAWKTLDHVDSSEEVFEWGRWVLPAAHLQVGDTPYEAAGRVAVEQLRAASYELRPAGIFSHQQLISFPKPTVRWALCFAFEADVQWAETPPWFAELKRVQSRYLRHDLFARLHGDVVADMGLLPP